MSSGLATGIGGYGTVASAICGAGESVIRRRRWLLPISDALLSDPCDEMVYVTVPIATPGDILERICRENLAVYRESPARLQEDVSQESQVAHDYKGRLVYELLQNADDALVGVESTEDRALFRLSDTDLWIANTGRPFNETDVRGLCGLGASSKTQAEGPRRASIGHKGLGFKSVLEITDHLRLTRRLSASGSGGSKQRMKPPDCRISDERVCVGHQGSWETAEDYDSLRWQLDSSCHVDEADRTKAAAPNPGEPQDGGTPEPDEYVPPAVPDTSRSVPPEVCNAIADYAREVNRPVRGPDRAPYISPDEETALAGLAGDSQADPGPTEDQITSWNEANEYWNEADDYEPDKEAGE